MKNKDIVKLYEGLCELNDFKFKPKVSFTLAKDKINLEPLYTAVIKCQREILEQYGEQKEDGTVLVPNAKIREANIALEELMEIDNKVDLNTISIDDFGDETVSMDLLGKIMGIVRNA